MAALVDLPFAWGMAAAGGPQSAAMAAPAARSVGGSSNQSELGAALRRLAGASLCLWMERGRGRASAPADGCSPAHSLAAAHLDVCELYMLRGQPQQAKSHALRALSAARDAFATSIVSDGGVADKSEELLVPALRALARAHSACDEPQRAARALGAALDIVGATSADGTELHALVFELNVDRAQACSATARQSGGKGTVAAAAFRAADKAARLAVECAHAPADAVRAAAALVDVRRAAKAAAAARRDRHYLRAERSALGSAAQEAALDAMEACESDLREAAGSLVEALRSAIAVALAGSTAAERQYQDQNNDPHAYAQTDARATNSAPSPTALAVATLEIECGRELRELGDLGASEDVLSAARDRLPCACAQGPGQHDGPSAGSSGALALVDVGLEARCELGKTLMAAGRATAAQTSHRECLAAARRCRDDAPAQVSARGEGSSARVRADRAVAMVAGNALAEIGTACLSAEDIDGARQAWVEAHDEYRRAAAPKHARRVVFMLGELDALDERTRSAVDEHM